MKQEDKELLLQDLCARLPYGVVIHRNDYFDPKYPRPNKVLTIDSLTAYTEEIERWNVKPYLRPMSSMTEEEYKIYHELVGGMFGTGILINLPILEDFLNKNHFDYRGLIRKGLAIEVNESNNPYKTEE